MSVSDHPEISLVGGTGPLGRGLSLRLAAAGVGIKLGSRDPARARETAQQLNQLLPLGARPIEGVGNQDATSGSNPVILTIPYQAMVSQLSSLPGLGNGRVVVSTAVPMEFRSGAPTPIHPEAGSAAELVASLCPTARVVAALHTVAAGPLLRLQAELDEDVLVAGDDPEAKSEVSAIISRIPGLRPVDAGGLDSSSACEGITPLLLRLNRLHHAHTGIRIAGI